MKITTTHKIQPLADGKTARLVIDVFLEGRQVCRTAALSGPKEDIESFVSGTLSYAELEKRWMPKSKKN